MNIRRNQLLAAINSAKLHVNNPTSVKPENSNISGENVRPSSSKMARLIGKPSSKGERKSLLTRVGVRNRPTYDLIADGVLGKNTDKYQPKLSIAESAVETNKSVSERIKDLRNRTLRKMSEEDKSVADGFFGFENDGTPIWSSVVTSERKLTARVFDPPQEQSSHHHSIHIPSSYDWPKSLGLNNHNTFKTWFTVSENKRATQLAEQVIDNPQEGLNPLIFVGESDTGKTHLLQAIGQAALLTCNQDVYTIHRDELNKVLSFEHSWSDVFAHASMLIIDDIDAVAGDEAIANILGNVINTALNMNVHVIVSSQSMPDDWPASRLWDILRSGVKTILSQPGAGSLMSYARNLAVNKSVVLTDEQLALIVTHGEMGWRATKNSLTKAENAINNGEELLDNSDVYNLLNDIQSESMTVENLMISESVEDVADRLIKSVVDVVYSEQQLGGIEFNTTLPELSDDYEAPELLTDPLIKSDTELIESQLQSKLDDITPVAPSVIDVNDQDKHLVAKMTRIMERDHAKAAEILTDIDMGIDEQLSRSNYQIASETDILVNLEAKLLNLAERTAGASVEGLIEIADELRSLEHDLITAGANNLDIYQGTNHGLDSYVPTNDWNIDDSEITAEDLGTESSMMIPIEGVLEPHPEGVIRTATLTPVTNITGGEEE